MADCNCDMHTKLVGDGCEVCNPALALEYAKDTIAENEIAMKEAAKIITELCKALDVPLPMATLDKLGA